jgi:hypothetical protein
VEGQMAQRKLQKIQQAYAAHQWEGHLLTEKGMAGANAIQQSMCDTTSRLIMQNYESDVMGKGQPLLSPVRHHGTMFSKPIQTDDAVMLLKL